MKNIWEFLLQTMEVSWAALFLLILKRLLADKLSPRWQYGIWSLFFVRLLVPAGWTGRYLLTVPAVLLQTLQDGAEPLLSSRFSTAYVPVRISLGLPWLAGRPESPTDWLFVLYLAGVVFFLVRYALSYLFLRLLLKNAQPVSAGFQARLDALCGSFHLRGCRAVILSKLPSAFICGMFAPVLALPSEETDDKILLHELLHLRSRDALQSIVWTVFCSVHWCNPFLRYVFRRIGNDLESLCDQRVLERLTGEERRRYGELLLTMTNDRYPRAPGTTSLSNGGKNIRRRIAAIARFRRYPAGMGLVSVCIGISLLLPLLCGVSFVTLPGCGRLSGISGETFSARTSPSQSLSVSPNLGNTAQPSNGVHISLQDRRFSPSLSAARLVRCTTAAGAMDTFAKGLMLANPIWLTAAGSELEQAQIARLLDTVQTENLCFTGDYYIYNPMLQEDGSWQFLFVFPSAGQIADTAGEALCYYVFPASLDEKEDGSWTVAASGAYTAVCAQTFPSGAYGNDALPVMTTVKEGETGTFTQFRQLVYTVQQSPESIPASSGTAGPFQGASAVWSQNMYSSSVSAPDIGAVFSFAYQTWQFLWEADETFSPLAGCSRAQLQVTLTDEASDGSDGAYQPPPDWSSTQSDNHFSVSGSPSSDAWTGSLSTGGGSSFDWSGSSIPLPDTKICRLYIAFDGSLQEYMVFP